MLEKGRVQALHRMRAPLKLEDGVVFMKSFHLNNYVAFMMTKLLIKKF